ncbi:SAM-dependent methyltransferase [Prauserella muralis]|uniref:Methyltransferase n=1 Tax=Prauserella muralis TaxID=588067 RepID=A0A2V4AKQ8_9PSEU|nr:SAM-dependent methyltransferase [Prauserella muralis]PXY20792.1 methyltransferase [Prauserella muralis]TWE29815.1 S-adenosyl methyltransferase [Prauserella muralis]
MAPSDGGQVPEGVDLDRPNPARIYDWYLGGTTNWAIDREFGAKAVETFPMVRTLAKVGREFLGRGVQYLARQGVRQFLDLGSGVPTVGNVHEIADSVNPDSRCVYVDNEPVAVAHSRVLLEKEGDPNRHAVLHGDLRHAEEIWERALDTGVLDPREPIGLIVVGVLYFFGPDDDPHGIIARYRDMLPSGSYFLSSHMTVDGVPVEGEAQRAEVRKQYERSSSRLFVRSREEFARFFDGFELVEPGVVWIPEWRPDERPSPANEEYRDKPAASSAFAGLGYKP